ncbi:sulfatase [Halomarina ordinaria]|uniref:Sulfatase n=1 Tax=Halomarina ordinaria TaxID=3033939 RepID=A0ABD5U9L2_9EURY|nr:sulfatase [Halomarina sp. PSRA2]
MTGARPNVVVTVLDTVRARDTVPAAESPMPELGALAAEGAEFTNAFATAPWTLPSHASLFTGTYPSHHGARGGHTYLDESLPTLAEGFRDAGYETVGVSNNTWVTAEFGFDRGFETFRKGWQYVQSDVDLGAVVRAEHPLAKVRALRERLFDGNPVVNATNVLFGELADDQGAERTTSWVEAWLRNRDRTRPFLCFLNYIEPHIQYHPPREYAEAFLPEDASYEEAVALRQDPRAFDVGEYDLTDREFDLLHALYRGELAALDAHLGRLREALRAAGEWEDTLLVVLGDHGENIGDHGFLGHQYDLHDTLLHVPLVVCGPGFRERREDLVQPLDLVPTLLDAAGIEAPELRERAQGYSLHPDADAPARDAVFAEYLGPQPSPDSLAERFGSIPDRVRAFDRTLRAIRTDEEKYIRASDGTEWYYRVAEDPEERENLAREAPRRTRALDARLDRWLDSFDHADPDDATVSMSAGTRERLSDLGYL